MPLTSAFLIFLSFFILNGDVAIGQGPSAAVQVLEDFTRAEPDGFPVGWHASRNESVTRKAYVVARVTVAWRWRLRAVPSTNEAWAAVFVSLDTDLLVIPVSTKYVWASAGSVGTVKEGGLFGAAEVVIRSGSQQVGQWVEERVNAYADFLKVHNHEPAPTAWGISLVTGPGVELDFGRIAIAKQ